MSDVLSKVEQLLITPHTIKLITTVTALIELLDNDRSKTSHQGLFVHPNISHMSPGLFKDHSPCMYKDGQACSDCRVTRRR